MPKLDATQSCAEAFREICRTATDHILHNWVVVAESDDPEGTSSNADRPKAAAQPTQGLSPCC